MCHEKPLDQMDGKVNVYDKIINYYETLDFFLKTITRSSKLYNISKPINTKKQATILLMYISPYPKN